MDFKSQVIAETEAPVTWLDGNSTVLQRHKHHDTTPEYVDFRVKEREQWEVAIKPLLTPKKRRINSEPVSLLSGCPPDCGTGRRDRNPGVQPTTILN
jgi:hypothetical protein